MKIIIAFSLCIIASHAVVKYTKEETDKMILDCVVKLGIDPALIGSKDPDPKKFTPHQQNCYSNCMQQKLGMVHENGTVNFSFFNKHEFWNKMEPYIINCNTTAGGNGCALSSCLGNAMDLFIFGKNNSNV